VVVGQKRTFNNHVWFADNFRHLSKHEVEGLVILRTDVVISTYLAPMRSARLIAAIALSCLVSTGHAAVPSRAITLEGILEVGEFYGPPNYGETPNGDRIERSLYLQLPATPNTQLPESEALARVGRDARSTYLVQIVVHDAERSDAEKAIGHRVKIVGVPFEPLTGHHRAPLLVDVRSLKSIDTWSR